MSQYPPADVGECPPGFPISVNGVTNWTGEPTFHPNTAEQEAAYQKELRRQHGGTGWARLEYEDDELDHALFVLRTKRRWRSSVCRLAQGRPT